MVGTWKQTLPTRAHLSEEGCWGRALEPLGCHDCLLPSGPLSDAARARGGGTRPVPPVRARRSCCTSSSWSSRGMCACPSRGLVGWWLGWRMACSGVCRAGPLGWGFHSAGACWESGIPGPAFPRQESSHTFRVFPIRHLARSAPDWFPTLQVRLLGPREAKACSRGPTGDLASPPALGCLSQGHVLHPTPLCLSSSSLPGRTACLSLSLSPSWTALGSCLLKPEERPSLRTKTQR